MTEANNVCTRDTGCTTSYVCADDFCDCDEGRICGGQEGAACDCRGLFGNRVAGSRFNTGFALSATAVTAKAGMAKPDKHGKRR